VQPYKKISDSDNEKAHFDREAEKIIRFVTADPEHQFIVDKTLRQDEGLTCDVFKDPEPSEKQEEAPELDEEGNPIEKVVIEVE